MAFRFRPVYYNEVKSPFFIVNNTKSVYELSKICMSFFMFMLYGRLLNLLPTFSRLASVASFGTDYFLLKIIFLAKRKREFTTKFAIAPNVCWRFGFLFIVCILSYISSPNCISASMSIKFVHVFSY